ncbi:hypothetical protein Airi02_058590 [Actinoallomurus iriomotensis]|uniref:Uncharacterized protein n=2 Tax=Actinoallomurus iriomotensis TaxID=478107 RepID=A0A9W6S492_9ACTN|nr:hypothetical protein Airi02_058590 [Actinoallomurus iriomotensis]
MAAMSWSATILPLVGVAVGAASTLTGQYLTTRVAVRREEREQSTAERTERKDAILGFLSAAQSVELLLDRRPDHRSPDDAEMWDRLHDLWLAKKACELVCSPRLAQAAHDYTVSLHDLLRGRNPTEQPDVKRELRYALMEAARTELGVTGDPLRRGHLKSV